MFIINKKHIKQHILNFIKGFGMGAANVILGVSVNLKIE